MAQEVAQKKKYRVKDANALFIAGARVGDDRTVELFEDAARYELLADNLEEVGPAKSKVVIAPKSAVEG